jgi:hypothetical protein
VGGAYIYERITAALKREEVIQRVVSLMERTGPQQPSKLTLADGSVITGVPIGLQSRAGQITVGVLDPATNTQHPIAAETVLNIE